jgi:hypothetical protein
MSTGLLFVTAPDADYKAVNKILLHIKDWEHGSDDRFLLVKDKSGIDIVVPENGGSAEPTSPPVPSLRYDGWAGASPDEVEAFLLEQMKTHDEGPVSYGLYVIVDEKGMRDKTCILGEQEYDDEKEDMKDSFQRVRLPWDEVYSVWW